MAYLERIKNLMGQYGGNPADAPYWANQMKSRGEVQFLKSPSFKNMTGQVYRPGSESAALGPTSATPTTTPDGSKMFDLPTLTPDIHPRTGIDWESSPVLKNIQTQLGNYIAELPSTLSNMGETLQGQYTNLMNRIAPRAFQETLNQLGARNVLDSSVASDALAKGYASMAQPIGEKAYQSNLAQIMAQLNMPFQIGQLARNIGQVSQDPLATYRTMLQWLKQEREYELVSSDTSNSKRGKCSV